MICVDKKLYKFFTAGLFSTYSYLRNKCCVFLFNYFAQCFFGIDRFHFFSSFFLEKTISSKGTVSQDFDFKQTLRIDSFIYRRGMYIPRITELKMTEWKTV